MLLMLYFLRTIVKQQKSPTNLKHSFNITSKAIHSHGFDVKLGKYMTMILDFLADVVDLTYFVIQFFAEYRQRYYIG